MCADIMSGGPTWIPFALAIAAALCIWATIVRRRRETFAATPRAYVISLKNGSRSRDTVRRRFGSQQSFVFWDAVDGHDVIDRSRIADGLRPGQAGCAISHMELWRALAGSAEEATLVFEDDAKLCADWASRLSEVMAELDPAVDAVFLGHCGETEGPAWKTPDGRTSRVLRHSRMPRCTHAYLVTAKGARKLAAWAKDAAINKPIDEELGALVAAGALNCLSCHPPLVTTFDDRSTINF